MVQLPTSLNSGINSLDQIVKPKNFIKMRPRSHPIPCLPIPGLVNVSVSVGMM